MPKLCKPTVAGIVLRMRAAERLNNRNGGTYYGSKGEPAVFPIETFGVTNASRTGVFTFNQILDELKLQNKETMTITAIYKKVDALKARALELGDIHALIRLLEKEKAAGREVDENYLTNCKKREQKLITEFEKLFGDK